MFGPMEYSEFWLKVQQILEILYEVITFVLLAAVIFYGIRAVIRFVKENFTRVGKKKPAKKVLSNQDIRESCTAEKVKKERRSFLGFLSNEQRVRALYRKRVLQEKDKLVGDGAYQRLNYMTAKECCEEMEAADLKQVYEKVRYSAERVTGEDVRRAKG